MVVDDVHAPRSTERRRWHRVRLTVPIQLGAHDGQTADVSLAGAYVVLSDHSQLVLGNLLKVRFAVPSAARQDFPFARIATQGRVVRVEERGVGLAFCQETMTALAALPQATPSSCKVF